MIVVNKKRIITVVISVFLIILIFILSANLNKNSNKYISTVSLPVSGKVVIVDAGHGTPDVGVSLLHKVKNKSNYSFIKN